MLKKLKPTTPGQRGTVLISKNHLWKKEPYKLLTKPLKEKLKAEAMELNLLKRTSHAKLPL